MCVIFPCQHRRRSSAAICNPLHYDDRVATRPSVRCWLRRRVCVSFYTFLRLRLCPDISVRIIMALRSLCTKTASVASAPQFEAIMSRLMSTTGATASKIGFIGLGNMGGHMVTNLLNKVRLWMLVNSLFQTWDIIPNTWKMIESPYNDWSAYQTDY